MTKKYRRLVVILALTITALFLLQISIPALSAASSSEPFPKSKAKPLPYAMPKSMEIPVIYSSIGKVDPRIYSTIESGAKEIEVLILYDWEYRDQLLEMLPSESRFLNYATDVIKYIPILGIEIPADREVIQNLASLPYVKLIAYNEPLSYDMLQVMDPKLIAEMYKKEMKGSQISEEQVLNITGYTTPLDVAIETRATELWKMGYTGKGVIIGVIDTGINPRHPDFFFPDGRSKIIYAFSPFSGEDAYTTFPVLYSGHGTHVASIAAASGLGSGQGWYLDRATFLYKRAAITKGQITGLAPDAYLAVFKIFRDPFLSREPATVFHVVVAIVEAVKVGVDIINASWGFIAFSLFTQFLIYYTVAWAVQSGVLWVSAAGNYGPGYVTLVFPAAQESVLTVGITYPLNFPLADFGQKVVYWSSRGPTYPANSWFQNGADIVPSALPFLSAGRVKPDVVAPGFGIMAANAGFEFPSPYETIDPFNPSQLPFLDAGVKYKTLSGTSMATPVVAGIAALLIQAFPGATPAAIKAALIKGAKPTTTLQGVTDPNIIGAGIVDALNSYNILKQAEKKSNFKIPPPYWVEEAQITPPDAFKKIFAGYKILVNDITAVAATPATGEVYTYSRFIRDLIDRGASVVLLSTAVPWSFALSQVFQTIESPHPYEPMSNQFYHIYYPGARAIRVFFGKIELASPNSFLVIYSWDFSRVIGVIQGPVSLSSFTVTASATPGVHIRLITDKSIGYGFRIDWYAGFLPKPSSKPTAEFFRQFDLLMILSPWYVDPDWIDRLELKRYVEDFNGKVLFVGGYVTRVGPAITYFDEPLYMIPSGSEVGTPVKMNYYTWEFGVEWVRDSVGGAARIVVTNPIFAPGLTLDGKPIPPRIYLGSQVMSMKLRAGADPAKIKIWAYDPVYPAIVFYNSTSTNGVLMISDSFVLSNLAYGSKAYPFHQWFGLRAVAYLLNKSLIPQVNTWFYPIGFQGLFVRLQYNKMVTNGTVWTVNYTLVSYLPYSVLVHAVLEVPSNSTMVGIKKIPDITFSSLHVVVPPSSSGKPSVVRFALGGLVYTKTLTTSSAGIGYYPVFTELWGNFIFNTYLHANLTLTGSLDVTRPVFSHNSSSVNVLNKIPRQGDLPLVSVSTPFNYDSYTANLIAKYPFDWKYVTLTVINPDVSIRNLRAQIVGNVSTVAQFASIVPIPGLFKGTLLLEGASKDIKPEDVSEIAGQLLRILPSIQPVPGNVRLISPQEGYFPGLSHTGHYFAFLFVFIPPNIAGGTYSGEVQILDGENRIIASTKLSITVEQRPNGYIIWDDGLYVNNRPAVDFLPFYDFEGHQVFFYHDWPMQPWINAFDLWKTMTGPILNFNVKPSGALSIALDMFASGVAPTLKVWELEDFYRSLVENALSGAKGFLLVENYYFRPFDGYYFDRDIMYGPENKTVTFTAMDVLKKVLNNSGTLIIFSQFGPASPINPISRLENPYNMNWLLESLGSRIRFAVEPNTSAANDLQLFTRGLPSFDLPITAGWRTLTPFGLPYNTLSIYYLFGYLDDLIDLEAYLEANRKLFIKVNSENPDELLELAQFFVENSFDDWQVVSGKWGAVLALDTKLSIPNAKVIAFGESSFFENMYFQHYVTHATDSIFERAWGLYLTIFLRSVLQYVQGYYSIVTEGLSSLLSLESTLRSLISEARKEGMMVNPEVDRLLDEADSYISQLRISISAGNFIAASSPLFKAKSLLEQAATILLIQLGDQVKESKNSTSTFILNAYDFIRKVEGYNLNVDKAKVILSDSVKVFRNAASRLASFNETDPATWIYLVASYSDFKVARNKAMEAVREASNAAYNLANSIKAKISSVIESFLSDANKLTGVGIAVSKETNDKYNAFLSTLARGNQELSRYVSEDFTTYSSLLNAINIYNEALGLANETQQSLLKDAKEAVLSRISELRATIAEVRSLPHNSTKLDPIDAKISFLEIKAREALSASDFATLYKELGDMVTEAKGSVVTVSVITVTQPQQAGPAPWQLATIIALIIILIFAILFIVLRRRS